MRRRPRQGPDDDTSAHRIAWLLRSSLELIVSHHLEVDMRQREQTGEAGAGHSPDFEDAEFWPPSRLAKAQRRPGRVVLLPPIDCHDVPRLDPFK